MSGIILNKKLYFSILAAGLLVLLFSQATKAEEGGSGHYSVGGMATLFDILPTQSGLVIQTQYLGYDGGSGAIRLPLAGNIAANVDTRVDSLTLGAIYTFESQVLGAYYSAGAYIPYMWMDVTATLTSDTASISRTDSVNGFGDMAFVPLMMAWKPSSWQFDVLVSVYAPTGDYEVGQLANPGLNYWTADPTVGVAYNNEETGFNFAFYTGVTFNSENDDTDYTSGSAIHAEVSVQQLLPLGKGFVGFGVNGFLYEQISGDSGHGATLGDFKGHSLGIGPALSYVLPSEFGMGMIEVRWLPELDTDNRLEGDYLWIKALWQF